jgi:hypothetical protein
MCTTTTVACTAARLASVQNLVLLKTLSQSIRASAPRHERTREGEEEEEEEEKEEEEGLFKANAVRRRRGRRKVPSHSGANLNA